MTSSAAGQSANSDYSQSAAAKLWNLDEASGFDLDALSSYQSNMELPPTACLDCVPCKPQVCRKRFDFRGWINAGYVWNVDDPDSKFNGPYNAVDRSNEPMLNQFYLIGEKLLPTAGLGMGARVDLLYGEDFFLAESIGLEKRPDGSARWNPEFYGLALPQAYVSFGNE
jgi:hypothetical protein